jgi:hypothetical protein
VSWLIPLLGVVLGLLGIVLGGAGLPRAQGAGKALPAAGVVLGVLAAAAAIGFWITYAHRMGTR